MTRRADNHIRVTEETWERLNKLKKPGDSFDDVIQRLLAEQEGDDSGNPTAAAGG
jgi:predicted CopG family antitoxin